MELIYVIPADAAEVTSNGKFSLLGGGIENIFALTFPAVQRKLGFTVRYKPTRNNIAHCVIEDAKTETDCARLAEITRVHTLPPSESGI